MTTDRRRAAIRAVSLAIARIARSSPGEAFRDHSIHAAAIVAALDKGGFLSDPVSDKPLERRTSGKTHGDAILSGVGH